MARRDPGLFRLAWGSRGSRRQRPFLNSVRMKILRLCVGETIGAVREVLGTFMSGLASSNDPTQGKLGAGDGLRTRDPQLVRLEGYIHRHLLTIPKSALLKAFHRITFHLTLP